ncbi:MAG TPA: DsbA family oxidoreductase [Xanthomonadales bacterium]|nr:DsbA family oxidoreductase [Xanthomonadales bacterium]
MAPLKIEVWSDIACPWCWIGKRGLDAALERFEHPAEVRFRAFELNPQAPLERPEKFDYVQHLMNKYRMDREQAQQTIDRVVSTGRERGVEIRYDRVRPTNTFDAHRLLSWAAGSGRQAELKEAVFQAYFQEGLRVSDHAVLQELAAKAGLDIAKASEVLSSDAFATEVRQDEQIAAQIGINGVPCFVFPATRSGISGAQPPEVLLEAMRRANSQVDSPGI